jgi:hypothetical protein
MIGGQFASSERMTGLHDLVAGASTVKGYLKRPRLGWLDQVGTQDWQQGAMALMRLIRLLIQIRRVRLGIRLIRLSACLALLGRRLIDV